MAHRNITLSYKQWEIIHKDEKSVMKKEKKKGEGGFHIYPNQLREWRKSMKTYSWDRHYTWSRGDLGGFPYVERHKLSDFSQNILDMQYYREKDGIPDGVFHFPESYQDRNFAGWALCNVYDSRTNTQISYHTTNEQWNQMRLLMGKKIDLEKDKRWFKWNLIDLFKEINEYRKIITFTTEQEPIYKTW
mgnify:CR=1 FL=1